MSRRLLMALVPSLLTLFLCSRSYSEDIIIDIGNGSGVAGSQSNTVYLSLDNSSDVVKGVQLYICDEGNYLTIRDCVATNRASNFFCMLNECKPKAASAECRRFPGCANIVIYSAGDVIKAGAGPIALIKYDVSEAASPGCITLNPKKAIVSDQNTKPLSVIAERGQFCIGGGSSDDRTTTSTSTSTTSSDTSSAESPAGETADSSAPVAATQSGFTAPMKALPPGRQETIPDSFRAPETPSRKQPAGKSDVSKPDTGNSSAGTNTTANVSGTTGSRLIISPAVSVTRSNGMVALDAETIANGEKVPGNYTWEIIPPSRIGSTIDADGIFTAGANTSSSLVEETIRVTDSSNNNVSSIATITVEGLEETPEGCVLSISPSSAEISPGSVITFTAEKRGSTCGEGTYEWRVNSKIGSTITVQGVYTAGVNRGETSALDIIIIKDTEADLSTDALVTVGPADDRIQPASTSPSAGQRAKPEWPPYRGVMIALITFIAVIGLLLVRKKK